MTIGGFMVLAWPAGNETAAGRLFDRGLKVATSRLGVRSTHTLNNDFSCVAVFGGFADGTVSIATDAATGAWLFSTGTWLHDRRAIADDRHLLARYLDAGPERLARELQGFFVVIAGDPRSRQIVVITDLIGSCRAYVRQLGETTAIAGSSLLLAALRDVALDPIGCQEFLGCGIVYEDRSFYADVKKLAPSGVTYFSGGALSRSERYWSVTELVPDLLSGDEAVGRFSEQLVDAAERIGQRFARPVCDLTAGYDSRGLAAGMLSAGARFSVTVSGPEHSADVRISRELAELAGLPHFHSPAPAAHSMADLRDALQLTHGEFDIVDYARVLATHRALATRFDISLNGSFGEVARGYWWELLFPHTGARRGLDCSLVARKRFAPGFDNRLLPENLRFDPIRHFTGIAERTNRNLQHHPNTMQMDHLYLMMRMRSWQGAIASSTNRLWPCLSPFLLRPLLETMLQTTAGLRNRSLFMRTAILSMQPRLANHPLEHGYPAVPARFSNLHRFLPLAAYYARKITQQARNKVGAAVPWAARSQRAPDRAPVIDTEAYSTLQSICTPLRDLLDPQALGKQIDGLRDAGPAAGPQWSRLLTLELALRVARDQDSLHPRSLHLN